MASIGFGFWVGGLFFFFIYRLLFNAVKREAGLMFIFGWDVESHSNNPSSAVRLSLSTCCVEYTCFMLRLSSAAVFTPRVVVQILVKEELTQTPVSCADLHQ